ncbi:Na+/H+ antiporter NhaC family protein [Faecalimicrobium dakarense]|uniref:Na+/H+ antiporter NhaC family protein n=1 Tax=Faecalimicrobium dakarense TaxID=1301100 RepID=UPI0004B3F206|nr:Na+/H+ antiporter NhaC family protein [[Clostridium] dakarense]
MEICKIPKSGIYLTLFSCIMPIIVCTIMGISLVYAFLLGIIFSSIISIKNGFKIYEIKKMVLKGVYECKSLYIVILLIGATVSVWLSSGVVPTMIYYGLEYMKDMNFLFVCFLLIALSSVFMGTAVGTISTIGVAMLGIGKGFGVPTNVLVGVIVSGSFIADKISPISGLFNLTLATTETNYKDLTKLSMRTLLPVVVISSIIYYFIGTKYQDINSLNSALEFTDAIKSEFFISPLLLFLPISIIVLSILGVKSIYCTLGGVICGTITTIIYQHTTIKEVIRYIILGFKINTNSQIINNTLMSGGVVSMISVLLIVIGTISLSSILQGTGIINYITKDIIEKINNKKELTLKTGFISSILTVITCDQTMGIVLPSKLLEYKYKDLGVSKNILARTISDTGTIIAPIIPWNVNSIIISLVTGVSCVSYAPYAVLCFLFPLITILSAIKIK